MSGTDEKRAELLGQSAQFVVPLSMEISRIFSKEIFKKPLQIEEKCVMIYAYMCGLTTYPLR